MCRLRSVFKTLCPSFTSKQITQYVHELDRGFRSCMKHSETIDFARSKPAGGDGSVSHSEFIHWIKNGSQDPRFTATQLKPSCFAQVFFLCFPLGGAATEDDPERDRRCDVCSSQRSVSKAQPETIHSFWAFYGILICGWMAMIAVGLIVGIKGMIRRQLCNTCCDSLVLRVFDFKPTSRVTP